MNDWYIFRINIKNLYYTSFYLDASTVIKALIMLHRNMFHVTILQSKSLQIFANYKKLFPFHFSPPCWIYLKVNDAISQSEWFIPKKFTFTNYNLFNTCQKKNWKPFILHIETMILLHQFYLRFSIAHFVLD